MELLIDQKEEDYTKFLNLCTLKKKPVHTDFQKMVCTEMKAVHTNLIEQLHFSAHQFYFSAH